MAGNIPKVLVVDDSAFARKVLREALSRSGHLEVVGTARDGLEALEKILELKPDVVTLDLVMPNLDGLGVLRELRTLEPRPRVVVVSISDQDSELVLDAFQLGAVDIVKKPTALATDRLYELSDEMVRKVSSAAGARPRHRPSPPPAELQVPAQSTTELVAIGTSTGGPQALNVLLSGLPRNVPVPLVIALHIPGDYTPALAKRLDQASHMTVVEAVDGMRLSAGTAVLAKGGCHLKVERRDGGLFVRVSKEPASSLYFPSVNVLFESAARACGGRVLGVVLTGMGDDGFLGAQEIVRAGGRVLTESEASSVVYGMPRAVREAGLSCAESAIDQMAHEIIQRL